MPLKMMIADDWVCLKLPHGLQETREQEIFFLARHMAVTSASCLQTGSAGRRLAEICGTPKPSNHGLVGELPSIGAGSSVKRKFKNTSQIRALKLVAEWKQHTNVAGTEETRKMMVEMQETAQTLLAGGGMV